MTTCFRFARLPATCWFVIGLLALPIESRLSAAEVGDVDATEERAKRKVKLEQNKKVALGKRIFNHQWQPRDASDGQGDGLGPLFNATSCAACHKLGALGGAGPNDNNVQLIVAERLPAGDKWESTQLAQREYVLPTATGNTFLLHRFGVDRNYQEWRRQRLSLFEGREHPSLSPEARTQNLIDLGLDLKTAVAPQQDGLLLSAVRVVERPSLVKFVKEERNTTALFGAGLIDQIQEPELQALADAQPAPIRGRVPRTGGRRIGRFGWKGQNGTLLEFNEGACAAELGLDTGGMRQAKTPSAEIDPHHRAHTFNISSGIDITADEIAALSAYVASLPAPKQVIEKSKNDDVLEGMQHFQTAKCNECHRRSVGVAEDVYSDLLLHDVGFTSSSGTYYGGPPADVVQALDPKRPADAEEFRTPPLWGVADSGPYLHDGRAATLDEAIKLHGGQARDSVSKYNALKPAEQKELVTFLKSLRAPRGLLLGSR